ncbi:3-hydroxyacyl-CoA dehydrogenase family protein [Niastella sp. OAS944]|uniref:3-hydroxyacyl-CoA dehydrogenase family protein n=1 Tax=Niastella sp. OAS944 TaxID=2664089 RepID=UPI00348BD6BB|nr:3-hydroxybutyryl-CoA dehydrogenase [Chitinophagaceae bacterium OAS944]
MSINNIAVVGAGTMGAQVALLMAMYGYDVILKDINDHALSIAKRKLEQEVRASRMFRRQGVKADDSVLERITCSTGYAGFDNIDLVIENIPENWEQKKALHIEMARYGNKEAIYAVNTSCIPIMRIASLHSQPEKIVGWHFMNPAYGKDIVEVIKSPVTSAETLETSVSFLRSVGNRSVIVQDAPGFVSNRLSHLLMNEAAFLVEEGISTPKDIDIIFKKGYGHAMGPLETADLIGIDTVVNSLKILYDSYGDQKFRCCPLLTSMVEAGKLGRKSGSGFFEYKLQHSS